MNEVTTEQRKCRHCDETEQCRVHCQQTLSGEHYIYLKGAEVSYAQGSRIVLAIPCSACGFVGTLSIDGIYPDTLDW